MQCNNWFAIIIFGISALYAPAAWATPTYDNIVPQVTTNRLINHIDGYFGMSCGSPTEDYASSWLYAFRQATDYSGDPARHQAAIRSLEKAISSPNGAYAVIYEQQNNHDNTSNPYLFRVFWTEDGKADYTYRFYTHQGGQGLYLDRKENSHTMLYAATVASPKLTQGGTTCSPEYISILQDTSTQQPMFLTCSSPPIPLKRSLLQLSMLPTQWDIPAKNYLKTTPLSTGIQPALVMTTL